MKNTLLTIFLVSVLFCGCGNNPIFSMMPDVASSGGGGGGGGSSELDINMSTFITGDPAPTGTLTTTISAKPTIKWTDWGTTADMKCGKMTVRVQHDNPVWAGIPLLRWCSPGHSVQTL